jgi:flagellar biosynthetic protein FliR
MSGQAMDWLGVALVVLARLSAFLAVLPFFAAARVPPAVRAAIAISLAIAVTPLLFSAVHPKVADSGDAGLLSALLSEIITGVFLGLLVRLFFLAVAFSADVIGQLIGYVGVIVPSIQDNEMTNPLADLIVLFSVVLFLSYDHHLVLIEKIIESYDVFPIHGGPQSGPAIENLASMTSLAFVWTLQLAAPFVIYVTICNLLLGLANRLVPQVPVQFVMGPAILLGGLAVAVLIAATAVDIVIRRYSLIPLS